MNDNFDIKSRERLVRVEEGILHLAELMEKIPSLCNDVESLKTTQKYVRWVSKTVVGAAIITILGVLFKGVIYYGPKG